MSQIYYGIDLGTGNSSISYIVDGPRVDKSSFIEPETIKFSPPPAASFFHNWQRLPSMVYINQKGRGYQIMTGFLAEKEASEKRAKPFENLFMSVKSDLGTLKIYEDSIHPDILTPVDVTAEIIKALIKDAEKETGISPKKASVVITVPASFTHNQREDTIKAAKLAGLTLTDGDLLDEPIAAFIHAVSHQKVDAHLKMEFPQKILVFDLGAGTCDISIFQTSFRDDLFSSGFSLEIRNKAISNYEKLGGDNVDLNIVQREILPFFCEKNGINFGSLQERDKRELRFRLKLTAKQMKEELCRQLTQGWKGKQIKQKWTIDTFRLGKPGGRTKRTTETTNLNIFMELMDPFITHDVNKSVQIFDDYITCSFFRPVLNAIEKAGYRPEDIQGFVFNGGSCHNPVIRQAFQSYSGFSKAKFFDTPDLDLSVSKGAAIHCYHLHKRKRSLVVPIMNSEIGLFTYGVKKERLIDAGTPLPFPQNGEFLINDKFCLPKDDLKNVGISIYSGEGWVISNFKLPLPEKSKKGDPVGIGVKIDSNKVLTVAAFMQNSPENKIHVELRNPWTHRIRTHEDMAANELWEKVATLKKARQPISSDMMIDLANKERLRGKVSGAIEILERLENKGIDNGSLNNILALCYDSLGLAQKALDRFRKAAELSPNSATLWANFGQQLVDMGKIDEGISKLRQAVNIDSEYYFTYYVLGCAYRKKGDETSAIREFTRALQILKGVCSRYPQNEHCLDYLIAVELALGQYEEADQARNRLEDIRNEKLFGGRPDELLAGPESGIWKMEDLFETQEKDKK